MTERALLSATIGLVAAISIGFAALVLSAGGDGWDSPIKVSVWLALLLPALGVSWSERHRELGHTLAKLVVFSAAVLDLYVIASTVGEASHFRAALRTASPWAIGWLTVWLCWQTLALVHLSLFSSQRGEQ
jgi:hypothetical protein